MPTPTSTGEAGADDALMNQIRAIIVEALMLEDIKPSEIDVDAPLFGAGEGLGLDSIDALELAMAVHKAFGVKTRGDDDQNREIFRSVRNLAQFVAAERVG